jgi:hypothetical protein
LTLIRAHLWFEYIAGYLRANNGRQRQRDVSHATCTCLHPRERQHSTLIAKNATQQICGHQSDCVIRSALGVDAAEVWRAVSVDMKWVWHRCGGRFIVAWHAFGIR